jgi:hypothetical protein
MRMRTRKKRTRTRMTPGTKTRTKTRTRIQMKETRRPAVVQRASKKVWGMGKVLQTCSSLARRNLSIITRMESEPVKA